MTTAKGHPAYDTIAAALVTLVCACGLIAWLDSVNIETTNGLWKSLRVERWKADPATADLDPSNYLYFPVTALLGRLLDLLGVYPDKTFKQLAVINAGFASIAVAIMHRLVWRLTGRRDLAALAALFQFGCGFFLVLSVGNEDIMPSFTPVLAAMAMAALWFKAPSVLQVIATAALFTVGWLGEWRLMFPALPALLLALVLSEGALRRRAGLCLVFVASMVAVVLLVANRWEGHAGAVGVPDLLWTGKGVGTGYGGFSLDKLGLLAAGIGEYWWGGHNLGTRHHLDLQRHEWLPSFLLQAVLLAGLAWFFWQRRADGRWRATAIVFLGTLAAGQVMNVYSQPQDPQMQLNVMPWLTLAWVLPLAAWTERRAVILAAFVLTCVPLAYNVATLGIWRGLDGRMEADLAALERVADPARTVFVYQGFEPLTTWHFARWSQRWEGVCDLAPAPLASPKFKWIAVNSSLVAHPSWGPAEQVAALKAQLDCACDKGYRLVAASIWGIPAEEFVGRMISIAGRDTALALYALMHDYRATPIGGLSLLRGNGPYSEIECPKRR